MIDALRIILTWAAALATWYAFGKSDKLDVIKYLLMAITLWLYAIILYLMSILQRIS